MCYYIPENSWRGEIYDPDYSVDEHCLTEDEWEEIQNTVPLSVIFWPTN
jgi:hypothetical protein